MSDENNVVPFSKDPDDEKARRVIAEAQRLARLPRDDWQAQLSDCAKSLDIEQGELANHIEPEHKMRVIAEARRLAGLAEVDWKYQVGHGSAERLGIAPKELEQYVKAAINDRKKAAQELERGADKRRQAADMPRKRSARMRRGSALPLNVLNVPSRISETMSGERPHARRTKNRKHLPISPGCPLLDTKRNWQD